MKISVVIPAYNEEKFLPRLLLSLSHQTFKLPYEIIVVDNNSSDKTAEIARSFGAKVVHEEKRGFSYACQRGFDEATGDIIARADADFVVPRDWLKNIWNNFEKHPDIVALGGPLYPLESTWWENLLYYPMSLTWMYLLKWCKRGFLFPNMAVRREKFFVCGGFNKNITFGEDSDMCLKLTRMGKVIITPSTYLHTSVRRLDSLGLIEFIIGYSIINQIFLLLGKEPPVGHEVIRTIPAKPPRPHHPWPYLWAPPAALFTSLALIALVQTPTPVSASTVDHTNPFSNIPSISAINKNITHLKNELTKTNFSTPSSHKSNF